MKRFLLLALLLLATATGAAYPPASPPEQTPLQITQVEKQFAFSDGSSYYQFKVDGASEFGPLGKGGHTIMERWTQEDATRCTVEGKWGWINGIVQNEHRRMRLTIQFPTLGTSLKTAEIMGFAPERLHNCYSVFPRNGYNLAA